ncbi:MAG: cadherin-like beta sandwich domain-containing protein [Acutalibacteraceae bacterium]|nr:cadherin-like beta sandwich domain-containing protein [Acutalibacteraceae bacterium]
MSMAGKNYAGTNTNRLKAIPLGSGNVYILPVADYPTMPTDEQFEQDVNMIGRTKNGATLTYSGDYYTAVSDDGVAKKTKLTAETLTFSWGIMTWIPATVELILQTATASVVGTGDSQYAEVKIGGVGNQSNQEYWVHFVGGDDVDGKITVTGRGLNTAGLEAAFANDNETVLTPTWDFSPMDNDGTLVVMRMANQNAQGSTAPQLTALTIGSLTLSPAFAAGTYEYTAATSNATNVINATAPTGANVVLIVNGNSLANGGSATWEDGDNIVLVTVSDSTGSNSYKITVTKS